MQNGIIKEFRDNPDVVALIYNEGGAHGETLDWMQNIWSNYYLGGKVIFDATGDNSRNSYNQLNTGLPFGRSYIIDQQGKIAAATFGYDPAKTIQTIYELLAPPATGALHELADGAGVRLSGKTVTAGSSEIGGAFYAEDADRVSAIRVDWAGHPAIPRDVTADVVGRLATLPSGERYVLPTSVASGPQAALDPLALTTSALGGSSPGSYTEGIYGATGLYNIGLLVMIFGKVTPNDATSFYIADGSNVSVKVVAPSGVSVPAGDSYVAVTGISSCYKEGDDLHRLLRVRKQEDIVQLQ